MKGILFILICLVLLSAGCVEQKSANAEPKAATVAIPAATAAGKLVVTVTSPHSGQILQGDDEVEFVASVSGGKGPYAYSWSSNIDGVLSTRSSFEQNPSKLSKGGQVIILKVSDAEGTVGQGSVLVEVM